jgi:hypothetical protein
LRALLFFTKGLFASAHCLRPLADANITNPPLPPGYQTEYLLTISVINQLLEK